MDKFVDLYRKIHRQCSYYSRHLGHMKALIENDDWMRVVDGSMLGRVLLLGNSETTNALVLFNTRMFDEGNDTITVYKLGSKIPTEKQIELHHNTRMKEIGIKYPLERYFQTRAQLIAANRELKKSSTVNKLRFLRDYRLAHNISPETEPKRATLNDLIELTEAVMGFVDLAGYIVEGSQGIYRDSAGRSEKETRMLYAVLPSLASLEADND